MMRQLRNDLRPAIIGIGVFVASGSVMTALAGTMLIWPGTGLDRLWSLNVSAHGIITANTAVITVLPGQDFIKDRQVVPLVLHPDPLQK